MNFYILTSSYNIQVTRVCFIQFKDRTPHRHTRQQSMFNVVDKVQSFKAQLSQLQK